MMIVVEDPHQMVIAPEIQGEVAGTMFNTPNIKYYFCFKNVIFIYVYLNFIIMQIFSPRGGGGGGYSSK